MTNKAKSAITDHVGSFADRGARILFVRGDIWARLEEIAERRGLSAEEMFGLCALFGIEYPDEVLSIDPSDVLDSL